ncbi:MAG TPA: hypothetical protein VGI83_05045, partial [Gemmatimonadales bacterium]
RDLDQRAKAVDRSRSRVVVDAVRAYLGRRAPVASGVAEETPAPYTVRPGLGEHRLQQLQADLKLTPTERVLAGENTAKTARRRRPPVPHRVIQFDRLEDFFAWQRADDLTA